MPNPKLQADEERHPNAARTPRTIHAWVDGKPVYLDHVQADPDFEGKGHSADDLKGLGYNDAEIKAITTPKAAPAPDPKALTPEGAGPLDPQVADRAATPRRRITIW